MKWQLAEGYSVSSVNRRLSTVKTYAKLAAKAGVLDTQALALIRTVSGYGQKEAARVNEDRIITRKSTEKPDAISITDEQAEALKSQPNTPQGRRDAVIMCLLIDHGLRCGEVAALYGTDINLSTKQMTFYREKVGKRQTHDLSRDTLSSARRLAQQWRCAGHGFSATRQS